MVLNVACPRCTALLDVTPEWLGQPIECGACSSVFVCPELAEEAPADDGPKVLREKKTRRDRLRDRDDDGRWDGYEEYDQNDDPDSYTAKLRGPGYATASMVLGIVSLTVGSLFTLGCCGFVQTILSVIGLILGYIGLRSEARGNAIAGMVMNVLGAIISVVFMSFIGLMFSLNPFGKGPPPPAGPTAPTVSTWKSNNPPPQQKAKW